MIEDVFLERLIEEVYKSYDEWYMPERAYHKHRDMVSHELDELKKEHIEILIMHYDKQRFIDCKNLYEERVKFLNEIQGKVDTYRGV
jgi:hypothetical protein